MDKAFHQCANHVHRMTQKRNSLFKTEPDRDCIWVGSPIQDPVVVELRKTDIRDEQPGYKILSNIYNDIYIFKSLSYMVSSIKWKEIALFFHPHWVTPMAAVSHRNKQRESSTEIPDSNGIDGRHRDPAENVMT